MRKEKFEGKSEEETNSDTNKNQDSKSNSKFEGKSKEEKNSDTNKNQDSKSNSKSTSQNNNLNCSSMFEEGEEAKNKILTNANRIEKELEEMKYNQSNLTDYEEKRNQIKSTTESERNMNSQQANSGYAQIKNSYDKADLKNEVNNNSESLEKQSSPINNQIKAKFEDKKLDEKKSLIKNEVIIINHDEIKKEEKNII